MGHQIPENRHTAEERCPVFANAKTCPAGDLSSHCDDKLSATQVFTFVHTGSRASAG